MADRGIQALEAVVTYVEELKGLGQRPHLLDLVTGDAQLFQEGKFTQLGYLLLEKVPIDVKLCQVSKFRDFVQVSHFPVDKLESDQGTWVFDLA